MSDVKEVPVAIQYIEIDGVKVYIRKQRKIA
jgi:hypothetical protein